MGMGMGMGMAQLSSGLGIATAMAMATGEGHAPPTCMSILSRASIWPPVEKNTVIHILARIKRPIYRTILGFKVQIDRHQLRQQTTYHNPAIIILTYVVVRCE
ncbi:uncharacterized protein PG998_010858 [Apiospora kogelbergensis]|uniref:Uncharacterized protein n=1 Tax=Apiospora kogelbergensis TaxID=1337665 RepID=A0AAW0RDB8_9PEZI